MFTHYKQAMMILFLSMLCSVVWAAPQVINYQGMLTDIYGAPITSSCAITFTFWDAESGGNQLGSGFYDDDTIIPNDKGMFTTDIGDDPSNLVPTTIFDSAEVWLNVNVAGEDLTPRKRINATAYSFQAGDLVCSECVDETDLAPGSVTADKLGDDLKVAFYAYRSGSLSIPNNTYYTFPFDYEQFDHGNVFDTSTGTFTAPATGVYHFDALIRLYSTYFEDGDRFYMVLDANIEPYLYYHKFIQDDYYYAVASGSATVWLYTGNTVSIYVYQDSPQDASVYTGSNRCWFSGFRVY